MTRREIINKALENKEISLDLAGQILLVGNKAVKKAVKNGELPLDLAGQILLTE